MKICYFVHDLGDEAVQRRVRMMLAGGACVKLVGFRRAGSHSGGDVAGVPIIELGKTQAARLGQRALSTLAACLRLGQTRGAVLDADVIIARQLEMLVLATAAQRRFSPTATIVFECLDIHRIMSGHTVATAVLRWLEGCLLRRCALLIVSSPAFLTHHFSRHRSLPPVRLVENKAFGILAPATGARQRSEQTPWRIGWFGVLRCRRSLALLIALVRAQHGRVEVVLRGRPAYSAIPDFDELTACVPGLRYGGPYDGVIELAGLYAAADFTWAIDFFEAGANSAWLLPNRLYEGGLYGSVPLSVRATATGHWLATRGAGVLLDEPLHEHLSAFFHDLTEARYSVLATALPLCDLVHGTADCERLVADLQAFGQAARRSSVSTSMAA